MEKILETINVTKWKGIYEKNKENSDYIVLDVRTYEEFEEDNIERAMNLDFYSKDFKKQLEKLDKNKKYLIYCRSGYRSSITLDIMKKLGFMVVYDLKGGFNCW
jgi:rhodanese-related sulfurtransferase